MTEEEKELAQPSRPRIEEELLSKYEDATGSWRIFKIISELVEGFELLRKYKLAVTFFGSARCTLQHEDYQKACTLAAKLSKKGFVVITGGGPGVMEAANRGAYEAGGPSIGLNIRLPKGGEQDLNHYVNDSASFYYFFTRKIMLSFASEAYVFFPGGFGTMDEFFELVTLVQTKKIRQIPIVLVGKSFWEPALSWIESSLLHTFHTISEEDTKLYHLVDTPEEAYDTVVRLVGEYCASGAC